MNRRRASTPSRPHSLPPSAPCDNEGARRSTPMQDTAQNPAKATKS